MKLPPPASDSDQRFTASPGPPPPGYPTSGVTTQGNNAPAYGYSTSQPPPDIYYSHPPQPQQLYHSQPLPAANGASGQPPTQMVYTGAVETYVGPRTWTFALTISAITCLFTCLPLGLLLLLCPIDERPVGPQQVQVVYTAPPASV